METGRRCNSQSPFFSEQDSGETIQSSAIMLKDTSKLAKELEESLNRHVTPTQGNLSRIGIKIESSNISIRPPIRIQQPMIQRQQYYTGDA